jgi:hypothetical protein
LSKAQNPAPCCCNSLSPTTVANERIVGVQKFGQPVVDSHYGIEINAPHHD